MALLQAVTAFAHLPRGFRNRDLLAKPGEIVYKQRIGVGGAFSASPVAADGRIYLTSEDGDVHVIKAGPSFEILATNSMGEVCMATPAISGGMIILRTQHRLFCIGAK